MPKEEKDKNRVLRLVVAGAAFFIIAVIGSAVALFYEVSQSPAFKEMMRASVDGAAQEKHDENKEADYLAAIEKARKSGDQHQLWSDLFDYGDWLFNDRPVDAQKMYREAQEIGEKNNRPDWSVSALAREGQANHKIYLLTGEKPDPKPLEEALNKNKTLDNDHVTQQSWLQSLAYVYADNGEFAKAEEAVKQAASLEKFAPQDQAEFDTLSAYIALKKGDQPAAIKKLCDALAIKDVNLYDDLKALADDAKNGEDNGQRVKIRAATRDAWSRGDFDAIDRLSQKLRESQTAYPDGGWELDTLYEGLRLTDRDSEKTWQDHLAKMRAWAKHSPDSPTPLVAWADNLVDYAWRARGTGWANTVSEEGWAKMAKRLELADGVLKEAESMPNKCPHLACVRQRTALGASMPRETYDSLVGSMKNLFPTYNTIYLSQAWYLQPRWNGAEGEWEKVAETECDKIGGTAGDAVYAQIAWYLMPYYGNVIDEAGVNYARAKRGLEALRKQYPKSKLVPLMQARMAVLAGDQATIAALTK